MYHYYHSFRSDNEAILYIDCKEQSYSLFRKLSNEFSKVIGYHIPEEKIREWIILTLNHQSGIKFSLLLDNFDTQISSDVNNDIFELIDIIDSDNHSIIYSIDLVQELQYLSWGQY